MSSIRRRRSVVTILAAVGLLSVWPAAAQDSSADTARTGPGAERSAPAPTPIYRDRFRDRSDRYRERYPRVFDLRPQFYRDRYGYRFGVPAFDDVRQERLENAYREGYAAGRDEGRSAIQAERGVTAYQDAMAGGHAAFGDGDYGLAARQFLLAAALNQGDPASRVCAANAQTALGEYESAGRLVERAFDLQPKLVYLPIDIRSAYGRNEEFTRHLAALREAAENAPENPEVWFLLGYYYFYSQDAAKAADALRRAADLRPENRLYGQLAELARPRSDAGVRRSRGTSGDRDRAP